jgi:hypothetical protein
MRKVIIACLFVICTGKVHSQVFTGPNYALKSHPTLQISKIGISENETVVFLSIENQIADGSFCADRNIFLITPEGEKLKLIKASGIPECPESVRFKLPGEKLQFSLKFPPLKSGTKWVDIIEDCSSNCFSFYGVTLDNELNKRLDEAFSLASGGKPAENIILFKNILDGIDKENLGIEGLLYINIINAAVEAGDTAKARIWYNWLVSSKAPRVEQYLKFLNDKGIKF